MKIDAFAPSWHEFKNSVTVEIRLLHSQQFTFTNSHSHFIIEELANFQVLSPRPKQREVRQVKARTTNRKTKWLINTNVNRLGNHTY
jgi:hypothetical protein